MITLAGHYFDGVQPVNVPARMDFTEQEAVLTTESLVRCYPILNLLVSPRSGSTARFVTLPDAGQFACPDHPSLDRLPQESPAEGPVAWLEARWIVAIVCVAVIVCTFLAGY